MVYSGFHFPLDLCGAFISCESVMWQFTHLMTMFVHESLHCKPLPYICESSILLICVNHDEGFPNSYVSSPHLSPQADLRVARPMAVSALHPVYLPLEGGNAALGQRLQPVFIVEHTGLGHSQLVSRELCNCV